MKKTPLIVFFAISIFLEVGLTSYFANRIDMAKQDAVAVNEVLMSLNENFGEEDKYSTALNYSILDENGVLIYKTSEEVSTSLNEAIKNSDTILNASGGCLLLIHNDIPFKIESIKRQIFTLISGISVVQLILILIFLFYIKKTVTDPFKKMNDFAVRVAGGDLDIPLSLDKGRAFGAFTESFDLMRTELKKSKTAEKKANDDKKEMIAKLSHDIKTPIASIKSTSEIGYELTKEDRTKELFNSINIKADQITNLADNLFHSSVKDITEIDVNPSRYESETVKELIKNSDYLNRVGDFDIPPCSVYIDRLRLQQAFDNVFTNSYKYANTEMYVRTENRGEYLLVTIGDYGPGAKDDELPLLKEKYKRGSNASEKEGAGLGLYLADYFLNKMNGSLSIERPEKGFAVTFGIRIV
ncbi:MAG: HAMP domain-containing histidine kinase [Lachnospiraceae bacterium]|nr:HAMP domain-containing histidine kinase [Lachnospiraceae bacterium]